MIGQASPRIAILYPGDEAARENASITNNRLADLFQAFLAAGARPEPAVYNDDFCAEVREQLLQVDMLLVWVNPIHEGRDRSVLDAMLREVAVAGFGFQAINALYPPAAGQPAQSAPQPGSRHYFPPTMPEAQYLRQKLENGWIQELQRLLDILSQQLPVLWDADFLFGPTTESGQDSYVLCEINVSSVAPFPDSAIPFIVAAVMKRAATRNPGG